MNQIVKRSKKVSVLYLFLFSTLFFNSSFFKTELLASTYSLDIAKGWQLIGVPTNIEDTESFNNSNVKLVWQYDAVNQKWLAFSPESELTTKITDNSEIGDISSIDIGEGIWIYSYNNWTLELDETIKYTTTTATSIDTVTLKNEWNLISLPIDTTLASDVFENIKIWKYNYNKTDKVYEWQTYNPYYSQGIGYPTIEEINPKDGLWVYSDSSGISLDFSELSSEIRNFDTETEIEQRILKLLEIKNRTTNHWTTNSFLEKDVSAIESITNINSEIENKPDFMTSDSKNIYFLDMNNTTTNRIYYQSYATLAQIDITTTPKTLALATLSGYDLEVKNMLSGVIQSGDINYTKNVIIAQGTRNDLTSTSSLTAKCKENRVLYSFIKINQNNLTDRTQTYFSIDGEIKSSRIVDNNLYLITEFEPCIDVTYPKKYLESDDICFDLNPEYTYDSITDSFSRFGEVETTDINETNETEDENQTTASFKITTKAVTYNQICSDVTMDENNDNYPYRFDYTAPVLSESSRYLYPQFYEGSSTTGNKSMLPNKFYTNLKLSQNPKITTVTKVNLETEEVENQLYFLGNTDVYFTSSDNLYLINHDYPDYYSFNEYKDQTTIYKFSLASELTFKAKGTIDGRVLNDFSISEDSTGKYLRIATANSYSWLDDSEIATYDFIVLQENNENQTLDEVATLKNISSGVEVKSVIFHDNLGFISYENSSGYPTYKIINLNDNTSPSYGGIILAIDQIFDYFKIFTLNDKLYLMAIGRSITNQTKMIDIKLYSLANLSSPVLESSLQVGDSSNYIPLIYDDNSFMLDLENLVFGFPVSVSTYNRTATSLENGFHLFRFEQSPTSTTKYSIASFGLVPPNTDDYTNFYGSRAKTFSYDGTDYITFLSMGKLTTQELVLEEE